MSENADPVTVTLRIAEGTLFAVPNSGNVRAKEGSVLRWRSEVPFSLEFAALTSADTWPFNEKPPTRPDTHFEFTLKDVAAGTAAPSYKYAVRAGARTLDPIVIVDKR